MSEHVRDTLLVVDDNPATLYSTARVLRGAGFHVVEAVTGTEAVERCGPGVDLVILDVNLPDFDGFEVCRRIRRNVATARVPVIHLSATFVKDVDKVHGLDSGADGYLTHPVEPPVLVATVNAFLRARQAEDAMRRSEAKFKAVFDNALNGIALISKELIFLDANPSMCRLLGLGRDAVVGKHVSVFMPTDRKGQAAQVSEELERQGSWRGYFPLLTSAARLAHLEWNISIHSLPDVRLAVVTDVGERIAIEKEREQLLANERGARADAELANRLKDEFLATLSHELRTPLNAIMGWSQILRRENAGDEGLREGLETIERNAHLQAQLIEDLLDVSRIISGKLRLDVQRVDLAEVAGAAMASVAPAAEARGVSLQRIDPADGTVIAGDPARLQQVIWNLLSNSIKFTPRGGRVRLGIGRVASQVEVVVSDTGKGIAPQFVPHVFERFRQADASTRRSQGGLGLGLAIVKQLVELHGGTVHAESDGVGRGAVFTVRLPVTAVHAAAPPDEEDHPTPPPAAPETPAPVGIHLDGLRVLAVDDEPDSRALLRRVLEAYGVKITLAASAAEAMQLLRADQFDVLLSDIGMPDVDGFDLIREVRRLPPESGGSIPAIALTAFARREDRERVLQAGFQTHVGKPVDAADLASTIGRAVLPK
jgi:PAS domain S-box-containing protein